jgi:hypothetical protein
MRTIPIPISLEMIRKTQLKVLESIELKGGSLSRDQKSARVPAGMSNQGWPLDQGRIPGQYAFPNKFILVTVQANLYDERIQVQSEYDRLDAYTRLSG